MTGVEVESQSGADRCFGLERASFPSQEPGSRTLAGEVSDAGVGTCVCANRDEIERQHVWESSGETKEERAR